MNNFELPEKIGVWQEFQGGGYKNKVVGCIYDKSIPTDIGLPLGGLGTGYITFDTIGHFGKTTIFNNYPEPLLLNSPVFAISCGDKLRIVSTKVPEGLRGVQNIYFWGHFPIVDMKVILDIPVELQIRAFSPFILNDANSSNLPGIFIDVNLTNISKTSLAGSLLFNLMIPKNPEKGHPNPDNQLFDFRMLESDNTKAIIVDGIRGGGFAIVLDSSHQYVVGKALDLKDISAWNNLLDTTKSLTGFDKESPGVIIKCHYELNPEEQKRFRYSLGWYYPYFIDSSGEPHKHHYVRKYRSALDVAKVLFNTSETILTKIISWQEKIYSTDYPQWLKDALVNGLYSLAKNTLWLINDRPDNWYPEVGLFTHSESFTGCPITETIVCRMHGHFPTLLFFPELEKSTLTAFRHYQLMSGEIPFTFGLPTSHCEPKYYCQHPINSSEYVQMVYRYYQRTDDKYFLKGFYESIKKAIQFSMNLDYDHDGLVNEHSHAIEGERPSLTNQVYDIWPWYGTSAYVAGIWMATLTCGIEMAEICGDNQFAIELKKWLKQAKKSYIEKLWTGKYFRLYNDPETGRIKETSLGNQLMCQWCVKLMGLPDILPEEKIQSALDSIEQLNFKATEYGLVNGVNPDGKKEVASPLWGENDHAKQIFIGENLCSAMTFIYQGRKKTGLEIAKRMYEAVALKHRTPWNIRCLISSDDGRPIWGDDYYSNMVIWALPIALSGKDIKQFMRSIQL